MPCFIGKKYTALKTPTLCKNIDRNKYMKTLLIQTIHLLFVVITTSFRPGNNNI